MQLVIGLCLALCAAAIKSPIIRGTKKSTIIPASKGNHSWRPIFRDHKIIHDVVTIRLAKDGKQQIAHFQGHSMPVSYKGSMPMPQKIKIAKHPSLGGVTSGQYSQSLLHNQFHHPKGFRTSKVGRRTSRSSNKRLSNLFHQAELIGRRLNKASPRSKVKLCQAIRNIDLAVQRLDPKAPTIEHVSCIGLRPLKPWQRTKFTGLNRGKSCKLCFYKREYLRTSLGLRSGSRPRWYRNKRKSLKLTFGSVKLHHTKRSAFSTLKGIKKQNKYFTMLIELRRQKRELQHMMKSSVSSSEMRLLAKKSLFNLNRRIIALQNRANLERQNLDLKAALRNSKLSPSMRLALNARLKYINREIARSGQHVLPGFGMTTSRRMSLRKHIKQLRAMLKSNLLSQQTRMLIRSDLMKQQMVLKRLEQRQALERQRMEITRLMEGPNVNPFIKSALKSQLRELQMKLRSSSFGRGRSFWKPSKRFSILKKNRRDLLRLLRSPSLSKSMRHSIRVELAYLDSMIRRQGVASHISRLQSQLYGSDVDPLTRSALKHQIKMLQRIEKARAMNNGQMGYGMTSMEPGYYSMNQFGMLPPFMLRRKRHGLFGKRYHAYQMPGYGGIPEGYGGSPLMRRKIKSKLFGRRHKYYMPPQFGPYQSGPYSMMGQSMPYGAMHSRSHGGMIMKKKRGLFGRRKYYTSGAPTTTGHYGPYGYPNQFGSGMMIKRKKGLFGRKKYYISGAPTTAGHYGPYGYPNQFGPGMMIKGKRHGLFGRKHGFYFPPSPMMSDPYQDQMMLKANKKWLKKSQKYYGPEGSYVFGAGSYGGMGSQYPGQFGTIVKSRRGLFGRKHKYYIPGSPSQMNGFGGAYNQYYPMKSKKKWRKHQNLYGSNGFYFKGMKNKWMKPYHSYQIPPGAMTNVPSMPYGDYNYPRYGIKLKGKRRLFGKRRNYFIPPWAAMSQYGHYNTQGMPYYGGYGDCPYIKGHHKDMKRCLKYRRRYYLPPGMLHKKHKHKYWMGGQAHYYPAANYGSIMHPYQMGYGMPYENQGYYNFYSGSGMLLPKSVRRQLKYRGSYNPCPHGCKPTKELLRTMKYGHSGHGVYLKKHHHHVKLKKKLRRFGKGFAKGLRLKKKKCHCQRKKRSLGKKIKKGAKKLKKGIKRLFKGKVKVSTKKHHNRKCHKRLISHEIAFGSPRCLYSH